MTHFHPDTSPKIRSLLEKIRLRQYRVRFHWGDTRTGLDWGDVYDVAGTVSRSTGPKQVPILIHNSRSMGGTHILDHCIVRIDWANKKNGITPLYKHPHYHTRS